MNSASGVKLFRDLGNTLLYTVVYRIQYSPVIRFQQGVEPGVVNRDESRGESLRFTREPGWSTSPPQGSRF